MPTQHGAEQLRLAAVESRRVVADFDGGADSPDAGALLLYHADGAIGLIDQRAGCFTAARDTDLIEHRVGTLIGQRVLGTALGYEDLKDHEQLRHDTLWHALLGKLRRSAARTARPVAGKSMLNRLKLHSPKSADRYH